MRNFIRLSMCLILLGLVGVGCNSTGGGQPRVQPGRNIATPDKMVGEGGLPPSPQK